MKKGIKKDNYFERNRIIQQTQKYRYNFIDYLYYQGERYNKRYIRSSGNQLITLYWIGFVFLPLLPFCTPHYTDIQGDILEKVNLIENLHPFTFCMKYEMFDLGFTIIKNDFNPNFSINDFKKLGFHYYHNDHVIFNKYTIEAFYTSQI